MADIFSKHLSMSVCLHLSLCLGLSLGLIQLFLSCRSLSLGKLAGAYVEAPRNEHFNQVCVPEGLLAAIPVTWGVFLAAWLAAATHRTTLTSWWEHWALNGTRLDMLGPVGWPWRSDSDGGGSKWWPGRIHLSTLRALDICGEGETSNVCISCKSKQWTLRTMKLRSLKTYLLPIGSQSLVKMISTKPCFHYILHFLSKKFFMLLVVQWNPLLISAIFVLSLFQSNLK